MSIPVPAVRSARRLRAFTLIEVLLASTLTAILLGMLLSVLGGVLDSWNQTSGREESYRDARAALQIFGQDFTARVPQREGISPSSPTSGWLLSPIPPVNPWAFSAGCRTKASPLPKTRATSVQQPTMWPLSREPRLPSLPSTVSCCRVTRPLPAFRCISLVS